MRQVYSTLHKPLKLTRTGVGLAGLGRLNVTSVNEMGVEFARNPAWNVLGTA